jgi:curved DNA-binding protein CbpA
VRAAMLRRDGDVMTADGPREPARDLYQLLGVARDASRDEIALAWRRRARDEHPDARQGDDGAPARFRALAEAWQVLGDPGRRAAYDRGLGPGQPPGRVRVTVRHPPAARGPGPGPGPGPAGSTAPPAGAGGPPLVAGPVRVEGGSRQLPGAGAWDEEDFRLALLAELVLRYRGRGWGRPW